MDDKYSLKVMKDRGLFGNIFFIFFWKGLLCIDLRNDYFIKLNYIFENLFKFWEIKDGLLNEVIRKLFFDFELVCEKGLLWIKLRNLCFFLERDFFI